MRQSVKIEEVLESDDVRPPSHNVSVRITDGKETPTMRHKRKLDEIRRDYSKLEALRVDNDFMYKMLSGKDEKTKLHHINAVVGLLKATFVSDKGSSLTKQEQAILDRILRVNNHNLNDALWFLTMRLTNSLMDWFVNGEVVDGKRLKPPPINSTNMLQYFVRSDCFTEVLTAFKEGKLDIPTFSLALRSEYTMMVGYVLPK